MIATHAIDQYTGKRGYAHNKCVLSKPPSMV